MKKMGVEIVIDESKFEDIKYLIENLLRSRWLKTESERIFKHESYFNILEEPSLLFHDALTKAEKCSKETVFMNVLIEIKYNVFSHFRNIDGYLRFLEQFNKYLVKFEKLNAKISKEIKKANPEVLELKIIGLKNKHETICW